jgi:hypothetical protein
MTTQGAGPRVLNVKVGESLREAGARAAATMRERGEDGRVSVPWSEIVVDVKLPAGMAA